MPFKSRAQEKFFNANRKKLEAQGVNVSEWNASSKGLKLPNRVKKTKAREAREAQLKAHMKKKKLKK